MFGKIKLNPHTNAMVGNITGLGARGSNFPGAGPS